MIPTRMNPMGCWQSYGRKLSYLESTGTQYIDTGYFPVETSKIDTYASFGSTSQYGTVAFFGVRSDTGHAGYSASGQVYAFVVFSAVAGQNVFNGPVYADQAEKTNVVLSKDGCYVNGRLIYTPPYTQGLESTFSLYAFAQHNQTGPVNMGSIRIYSFRISEGNTLVRDMIPVLDKSGVPCMYDRCTRSFYYNAGTGTFNYA